MVDRKRFRNTFPIILNQFYLKSRPPQLEIPHSSCFVGKAYFIG